MDVFDVQIAGVVCCLFASAANVTAIYNGYRETFRDMQTIYNCYWYYTRQVPLCDILFK